MVVEKMNCVKCKKKIVNSKRIRMYCDICKDLKRREQNAIWKKNNKIRIKYLQDITHHTEKSKNEYLKTIPVNRLLQLVKFKTIKAGIRRMRVNKRLVKYNGLKTNKIHNKRN